MMDINMRKTLAANSDQTCAVDLVGGPATITITGIVHGDDDKQPITISYEGDKGKPFKPSKTQRRIIFRGWGEIPAADYIGRQITLYNDPEITFGKEKTGGVSVSHLSHIDKGFSVRLLVRRGKYATFKVQALHPNTSPALDLDSPRRELQSAAERGLDALRAATKQIGSKSQQIYLALKAEDGLFDRLASVAKAADANADDYNDFPGDTPMEQTA